MKKVVALLGSKRRVNTYALLMQIKDLLAENDIDLEILELYRFQIKDCAGCTVCVSKGNCILTDDVQQIMEQMIKADGIILASPVYLQQVSGKMKTFIDRTCSWYHRPALTGKPVLCIATTKGSGLKPTLSYLENVATQWGALNAGSIGRSIFNLEKPIGKREIARFLQLLDHPESYVPTLHQLIEFEVQKSLALTLSELDRAYWDTHKWIHQPYFYPCRRTPIKRAISGSIGRLMRKRMGPKAGDRRSN
ncbi:MAG: flavodoxin family protein [Clostridiales bacterium]|nr:flavodoxin family protein [Clostridiales bacterium]